MLQQKIAIPAYFSSSSAGDADWSGAASAGSLLGVVVFNPASGPGYTPSYLIGGTKHAEYQARIAQMQAVGADVVGYVTTNYRDSRTGGGTVQREHRFTVDAASDLVTTRSSSGAVSATGWTTGFGPVQVRSDSTLPGGLAVETDYFWIAVSSQTGRLAASKSDAETGAAINLTSPGDTGADNTNHGIGLSRTLANISNVILEIDEFYTRWPNIDGMFFDEMNNVGDSDDLEYYSRIFDHVKGKGGKALVVENPGQSFPESMVNVADIFMAFESRSTDYIDYDPSWRMNHPATKFWHAIHTCPVAAMPSVIDASRTKNAGYIYVTDRVYPDQDVWLHLPSNFAEEIQAIADRNAPPVVDPQVPMVQELPPARAAARIRAAGLEPVFKGAEGPNSWVWRQSPRAGTRVRRGSNVTMQLRSGPRP